jgi:hypothetical protein
VGQSGELLGRSILRRYRLDLTWHSLFLIDSFQASSRLVSPIQKSLTGLTGVDCRIREEIRDYVGAELRMDIPNQRSPAAEIKGMVLSFSCIHPHHLHRSICVSLRHHMLGSDIAIVVAGPSHRYVTLRTRVFQKHTN